MTVLLAAIGLFVWRTPEGSGYFRPSGPIQPFAWQQNVVHEAPPGARYLDHIWAARIVVRAAPDQDLPTLTTSVVEAVRSARRGPPVTPRTPPMFVMGGYHAITTDGRATTAPGVQVVVLAPVGQGPRRFRNSIGRLVQAVSDSLGGRAIVVEIQCHGLPKAVAVFNSSKPERKGARQ
jgi:hypothetical protein